AVIALAGITFGIFVGEQRPGGIKHGLRDDILGGDQLDLVLLTLELVLDRAPHLWVGVLKMLGEKAASARLGTPRITCRHDHCSLSSTTPALLEGAVLFLAIVKPWRRASHRSAGSTICRRAAPATPKAWRWVGVKTEPIAGQFKTGRRSAPRAFAA